MFYVVSFSSAKPHPHIKGSHRTGNELEDDRVAAIHETTCRLIDEILMDPDHVSSSISYNKHEYIYIYIYI